MEHETPLVEYSSEQTFESKTMPGVEFTLYFASYGRKLDLHARTREFRETIRNISRERDRMIERLDEDKKQFEKVRAEEVAELREAIATEDAEVSEGARDHLRASLKNIEAATFDYPPEVMEELGNIRERSVEAMARLLNPHRLRVYVKSIGGLAINRKPATVERLISDGHPQLVEEILNRIDEIAGLSPEQQKNLLSPSTSPAAMDGETTATTATAAG